MVGSDSGQPGDELLVHRIRQGCEQSWVALYRRYQARIYRFALHMTGVPALAEDATQETFLAFLDFPSRFDPVRGTLGAFLFGIARNKVRSLADTERGYTPMPAEHDQAADAAEHEDPMGQEALRRALLALPSHYREVVVLCELQELEYAEAAAVLECPVGTVRSRLHRARQMLVERLAPLERGKQCPA